MCLFCLIYKTEKTEAQSSSLVKIYTKADTLRGSIGEYRAWWDVLHYTLFVQPDYATKSIEGKVDIKFKVIAAGKTMQIDLQEPMQLIKASIGKKTLKFRREGNAFFIETPSNISKGKIYTLSLAFNGQVQIAKNPPWDGGWIFTKDKMSRPWMSVACQGLGASVWFPCKDHQSDEPQEGASLNITVADSLVAVGNGRLLKKYHEKQGFTRYEWNVKNPINNYNIIPYIGKYVEFKELYPGKNGQLDCSYWVLDYNLEKAKTQFKQVPMM